MAEPGRRRAHRAGGRNSDRSVGAADPGAPGQVTPGHVHGGPAPRVPVGRTARTVLLGFLALTALGTVIGLIALWPNESTVSALQQRAQFAAPGVQFLKAEVVAAEQGCPGQDGAAADPSAGQVAPDPTAVPACATLTARLLQGPERGSEQTLTIPPAVVDA